MGSWPTKTTLRAEYDKLKYQTDDDILDAFISRGKWLVLTRLAKAYDVSTFLASPPQMVAEWGARMIIALYSHSPHFGATEDSGDRVGGTERQNVLDEIDALVEDPEGVLLDDSGGVIPRDTSPGIPSTSVGLVLKRTEKPIHTMGPAERSRVIVPQRQEAARLVDPWT